MCITYTSTYIFLIQPFKMWLLSREVTDIKFKCLSVSITNERVCDVKKSYKYETCLLSKFTLYQDISL